MTGTKKCPESGKVDMQSRLAVYPALQGAPKYELVLRNAEHSVFIDRPLPGDHELRNPNHHRVIMSLSTAFWDAYLREDPGALAWLNGLVRGQLWRRKTNGSFLRDDELPFVS